MAKNQIPEFLRDALTCPQCEGSYSSGGRCQGCQKELEFVAGVAWAFENPDAEKTFWAIRSRAYLESLKTEAEVLSQQELRAAGLTRQRLQILRDAKVQGRKAWEEILLPFVQARTGQFPIEALRLPHPVSMNLLGYYSNFLRDWGWGDPENAIAARLVRNELGNSRNLLILGGGSGRLGYDLHDELGSQLTLNMDLNPALILGSQALLEGRSFEIPEFPLQPANLSSTAVRVHLAPRKPKAGFVHVLADATRPPVQPGFWHSVLTPWFLDILPEHPSEVLPEISRSLALGGQWVYFGSVRFHYRQESENLSVEELIELAKAFGLELKSQKREEIPYMNSPHSAQSRREKVWIARFEKTKEVSHARMAKSWKPAWLEDTGVPVGLDPIWKSWASTHQIYAEVLGLIDGQRSLEQMGKLLAQRYGAGQQEMTASVTAFLRRLLEESRFQGLA